MISERPVAFDADTVRAILDGRKTATRKPIDAFPYHDSYELAELVAEDDGVSAEFWHLTADVSRRLPCPFGKKGDLLWVREPFAERDGKIAYQADEPQDKKTRWKPSMHMPREASRLTLEVTAVSVERLRDVSEKGALAEGSDIKAFPKLWNKRYGKASLKWKSNPWVWKISFKAKLKEAA